MQISKQEEKALFRFNIIFPLLDSSLPDGVRSKMIENICSKEYIIPSSSRTTICRATVWAWYRAYKKAGTIDALAPRGRQDKGVRRSLSPETEKELRRRYRENRDIPMKAIVDKAIEDGILRPNDTMCMGSLYRIFKEERNGFQPNQEDRRAYRAPSINQMWQSDCMHGPKVTLSDGSLVTAKLFVCIDNKSRLLCYGAWYKAETAEYYMDCLWNAFKLRGLPKTVYYDNGSSFRDERLKFGCASLGVQIIWARPYKPQGKGLVERFNRTVRQQFLSTLPTTTISLEELNIRFEKWADEYNHRPHSALDANQSPLQCYLSELKAVRQAPDNLPMHFRRVETRLVNSDRTIRFKGAMMEVPLGYSGRKLELRFFDQDPIGTCEAFFDGKSIGLLKPVDKQANYFARRAGATR